MAKLIKITEATLQKKVSFLCQVFEWKLSDTELYVLTELIKLGQSTNLSGETGKWFKIALKEARMKDIANGTVAVTLLRLNEKGVIRKNGTIITINPAFNGIETENEILIRFVTG